MKPLRMFFRRKHIYFIKIYILFDKLVHEVSAVSVATNDVNTFATAIV